MVWGFQFRLTLLLSTPCRLQAAYRIVVVRLASGLACSVSVPQVHRLRRIYKWSVYPRAVPTFLTKLPASLLRYFQSTVCVLRHVVYSKHRVSLGTHIEDWRILCASHRQVNAVYYTSLQTGQ